MSKFFTYEESPISKRYYIRPNHEALHLNYTTGSFNLICARVMGLTYADYLRMCRDVYGAEITGKGHKYPVANFKYSEGLLMLVKILNERAKYLEYRRLHPYEIKEEENKIVKYYDNGKVEEVEKL